MEAQGQAKYGAHLERQLSNLKLVSRLLTHELHSQGGAKTITLSREEVNEIRTTIDLFIEEVGRRHGGAGAATRPAEPVVASRTSSN